MSQSQHNPEQIWHQQVAFLYVYVTVATADHRGHQMDISVDHCEWSIHLVLWCSKTCSDVYGPFFKCGVFSVSNGVDILFFSLNFNIFSWKPDAKLTEKHWSHSSCFYYCIILLCTKVLKLVLCLRSWGSRLQSNPKMCIFSWSSTYEQSADFRIALQFCKCSLKLELRN